MSKASPDKAIPRQVEPRKFAHLGVELVGTVPGESLERLQQAVLSIDSIRAHVHFATNEQNEKTVRGAVDVEHSRECQRCLQPVREQLHCDLALAVVWDERDAKQLSSTLDPWIVADESADLYAVLEEEILLSMPFVAFHETACVDASLYHRGPEQDDNESAEEPESPFAVLKQLKQPKK